MEPIPISTFKIDQLVVEIYPNNLACGQAAATTAAQIIREAISHRGMANLILATGNSQLAFLSQLHMLPVEWNRVNIFHMDEYVGLSPGHPASFPTFLKKHLIDFISPNAFYPIQPDMSNPEKTCTKYSTLLEQFPCDLCVLGIGENGHLAFNDPPYADFNDPSRVKVIQLAERSRLQQVGEGHFASLGEVPTHAITLTIPALVSAARMLCIVPETRKAQAVKNALLGAITPDCPASILRHAGHCKLYLDLDSSQEVRSGFKPSS